MSQRGHFYFGQLGHYHFGITFPIFCLDNREGLLLFWSLTGDTVVKGENDERIHLKRQEDLGRG
jgi:hypothetical protein